jgi:hypothetical protein
MRALDLAEAKLRVDVSDEHPSLPRQLHIHGDAIWVTVWIPTAELEDLALYLADAVRAA